MGLNFYIQAKSHASEERKEQAISILEEGLKSYPNYQGAMILLLKLCISEGYKNKAREVLPQLEAINPLRPDLRTFASLIEEMPDKSLPTMEKEEMEDWPLPEKATIDKKVVEEQWPVKEELSEIREEAEAVPEESAVEAAVEEKEPAAVEETEKASPAEVKDEAERAEPEVEPDAEPEADSGREIDTEELVPPAKAEVEVTADQESVESIETVEDLAEDEIETAPDSEERSEVEIPDEIHPESEQLDDELETEQDLDRVELEDLKETITENEEEGEEDKSKDEKVQDLENKILALEDEINKLEAIGSPDLAGTLPKDKKVDEILEKVINAPLVKENADVESDKPRKPIATITLARVYLGQQLYEEGIELIKELIKKDPGDQDLKTMLKKAEEDFLTYQQSLEEEKD